MFFEIILFIKPQINFITKLKCPLTGLDKTIKNRNVYFKMGRCKGVDGEGGGNRLGGWLNPCYIMHFFKDQMYVFHYKHLYI
jgi:hypothetical protein